MEFLLGHSPDPDDAFMFYELAAHKIDTRGHEFRHILQDIETLNKRALNGELHISAVSIHAYAYLTDRYALLPCGASMGDGYGPMLVTKEEAPAEPGAIRAWLRTKTLAVPGLRTSAYLALSLFAGALNAKVVPFDQIFDFLDAGRAEVGLIIHEGQLTYLNEGFRLVLDLGAWWKATTGLPLPLGGNVIRKDIPLAVRKEVAEILSESIDYGLRNRQAGIEHSMPLARGLDLDRADRFIGMYVNEFTRDYGKIGRQAVSRFLAEASDRGLIPKPVALEFVE
jgi:1,4-dihydroxy-6-naphthoate synthase